MFGFGHCLQMSKLISKISNRKLKQIQERIMSHNQLSKGKEKEKAKDTATSSKKGHTVNEL